MNCPPWVNEIVQVAHRELDEQLVQTRLQLYEALDRANRALELHGSRDKNGSVHNYKGSK